jgi:hypothetical protein
VTLDAFLKALRATPRRWFVCPCGGAIRMLLKPERYRGDDVASCCPVTAVAHFCGIRTFSIGQVHSAGSALALDHDTVGDVAKSADNWGSGSLRALLLDACGLQPDGGDAP